MPEIMLIERDRAWLDAATQFACDSTQNIYSSNIERWDHGSRLQGNAIGSIGIVLVVSRCTGHDDLSVRGQSCETRCKQLSDACKTYCSPNGNTPLRTLISGLTVALSMNDRSDLGKPCCYNMSVGKTVPFNPLHHRQDNASGHM